MVGEVDEWNIPLIIQIPKPFLIDIGINVPDEWYKEPKEEDESKVSVEMRVREYVLQLWEMSIDISGNTRNDYEVVRSPELSQLEVVILPSLEVKIVINSKTSPTSPLQEKHAKWPREGEWEVGSPPAIESPHMVTNV